MGPRRILCGKTVTLARTIEIAEIPSLVRKQHKKHELNYKQYTTLNEFVVWYIIELFNIQQWMNDVVEKLSVFSAKTIHFCWFKN